MKIWRFEIQFQGVSVGAILCEYDYILEILRDPRVNGWKFTPISVG